MPPPAQTPSFLAQDVRRLDRDRFVTALFAPAPARESLLGLFAFNLELARVRELVSEPLLGRMRLQWWRETLDTLYAGGAVAHPVAQALAQAMRGRPLSRSAFDRLIDSREADLSDEPPTDLSMMAAYAEGTSSPVNALALEILGAGDEGALRAGSHVGIAWALTGLLRAVPFHAAAGRLYLPIGLLEKEGVDPGEIMAGKSPAGLAKVAEAVAQLAAEHLAKARGHRREVPKSALPALLTAPLADAYLARLGRNGHDVMDTAWSRTRPRPLRLALASLRGRY